MKLKQSPFAAAAPTKPLPYAPDGRFDWLRTTPSHDEWAIGDKRLKELPVQLRSLVKSAKKHGVVLPDVFVAFFKDASLHKHLRSANGDYLRLAQSVLPFANGFLARFLSDQQECIHWYLFLNSDGSNHCVVSSYEYFDADEMDYEIEDIAAKDFHFWAESFERFFIQYWLAHEVMFAENDDTPLPSVDPKILKHYMR